jgi:hypothetical protein
MWRKKAKAGASKRRKLAVARTVAKREAQYMSIQDEQHHPLNERLADRGDLSVAA